MHNRLDITPPPPPLPSLESAYNPMNADDPLKPFQPWNFYFLYFIFIIYIPYREGHTRNGALGTVPGTRVPELPNLHAGACRAGAVEIP